MIIYIMFRTRFVNWYYLCVYIVAQSIWT